MIALSPIQELEPGATPCRGGRCAAVILADHSSLKTKKYFDYDYKIPPMESDHRKGPCRARDGVLVNGLVVLAVLLAGVARQQLLELV